MKITGTMSLRVMIIVGATITLLLIVLIIIFEPLTRKVIAQDATCNYCHLAWEYNPETRLTATRPHASAAEPVETQAQCVDCHLPQGWLNTTYAYAHFLSLTDLYGYRRDRESERAGDWIPPRAATAYRVRERMFENDSNTCRGCHVESEIKFKRARGVNAHKLALKENTTCIECHNNLVHRPVDVRDSAFQKTDNAVSVKDHPA